MLFAFTDIIATFPQVYPFFGSILSIEGLLSQHVTLPENRKGILNIGQLSVIIECIWSVVKSYGRFFTFARRLALAIAYITHIFFGFAFFQRLVDARLSARDLYTTYPNVDNFVLGRSVYMQS